MLGTQKNLGAKFRICPRSLFGFQRRESKSSITQLRNIIIQPKGTDIYFAVTLNKGVSGEQNEIL